MRRTVVFFPDDASVRDCNISVVITNVSVEFTKLGSFGNIDSFATNLVNGLDRSYLLRARTPPAEPIQVRHGPPPFVQHPPFHLHLNTIPSDLHFSLHSSSCRAPDPRELCPL